MVYPEPASRIKKAAEGISGWDWPLLTFIYPGFDCGSNEPDPGILETTKHGLSIDVIPRIREEESSRNHKEYVFFPAENWQKKGVSKMRNEGKQGTFFRREPAPWPENRPEKDTQWKWLCCWCSLKAALRGAQAKHTIIYEWIILMTKFVKVSHILILIIWIIVP